MSGLMPVEEALAYLLDQVEPRLESRELALQSACGKVLATAQTALMDVPAYDNSAMDGYALSIQDLAAGQTRFKLSQTIAAGHVGQVLDAGTAARIFTGAPIPAGADAVVIQENCRREGDWVDVLEAPDKGANIRLRGHDIKQGSEVLPAGQMLRPQDMGLLSSLGISRVPVYKPLTVAVINTGDEIVPPDQPLGPGQIYDSNSFTLAALLERIGFEVLKLGIVADDLESTVAALANAAGQADCIISTGGVSVGEEDHVKAAVERLGTLNLWKLAIKPGKPFSFGKLGSVPFFGLPGNPVAVFITFTLLVRPYLLKMQGANPRPIPSWRVAADFERNKVGSRQEYLRVRLEMSAQGELCLRPFPDQGSSIMTSLSWADGLAVITPGTRVGKGDRVGYIPFSDIL